MGLPTKFHSAHLEPQCSGGGCSGLVYLRVVPLEPLVWSLDGVTNLTDHPVLHVGPLGSGL